MQQLLDDVWTWRVWRPGSFRGVSFNGHVLQVDGERVVVDPPPLCAWDREHLAALGGPSRVVVTNAHHLRGAVELAREAGVPLHAPAADRGLLEQAAGPGGLGGVSWFADGDVVGGLHVVALADHKTPGEAALHWPARRLVVLGDALIGTPAGHLTLLPAAKFEDVARARAGLLRLLDLDVEHVLVGDGEPALGNGAAALRAALGRVGEAPLEPDAQGALAPAGDGWFVLHLAQARWRGHALFGRWTDLEGGRRRFRQIGVNVSVLEPGRPSCMYHRESEQEDFLVLSGECLLLIDGQERRLRAGDFVHCPPGTDHLFVGAEAPAAVLMLGARRPDATVHYPVSPLAAAHGGSVATATDLPREAYAAWPEDPDPVPPAWVP